MSSASHPHYPICLIPPSLQETLGADPDRGELPKPPSVLSFASLFSLGLGVGILVVLLGSLGVGSPVDPWMGVIPVAAVGFAAWDMITRWQLRRQRLRLRRERQERRSTLLSAPDQLAEWRRRRLQTILRVSTPMLRSSNDPEGYHDRTLYRVLQDLDGVEVMWQQRVNGTYTPDVIVRVPEINLWIDAEVDDPWFKDHKLNQRRPRHCIGQDDFRNTYFLDRNWIVIRFAEEQVAHHPQGCAKEIARVLDQLYPQPYRFDRWREVPDLKPVAAWTEREALQIPRYFTQCSGSNHK